MCETCDQKLNRKSNKEKKVKKRRNNCPEDREKAEKLPKCPNPKRRRLPAKAKKCLTRIERIMLRIQPPIPDRERYFHPEHVNCFLEESERIYIKKPKCAPCPLERPKACVEDKKKKQKKPDENSKGQKDKDEKTENEKEKGESDTDVKESKENLAAEGDKENFEHKKAKTNNKMKRNKNKKNKQRKKDIEKDSESEMSICSNDSEVCLVGLSLTKEDKQKIEENRRKVHPPPDNGENSAESSETAEEGIKEEGEDNEN